MAGRTVIDYRDIDESIFFTYQYKYRHVNIRNYFHVDKKFDTTCIKLGKKTKTERNKMTGLFIWTIKNI